MKNSTLVSTFTAIALIGSAFSLSRGLPAAAATSSTLAQSSAAIWTVQAGNTLWSIAEATGTSVTALAQENSITNSRDLEIGETLVIPTGQQATVQPLSETAVSTWVVQPGNALWSIAQAVGVSEESIIASNGLTDPNSLQVGQVLSIPDVAGSTTQGTDSPSHSVLALQEDLATLGYLPLDSSLQWAYGNVPPSLKALWQPGQYNVMVKGAVMAFQSQNGLTPSGVPDPATWTTITANMAAGTTNQTGYSFAYVSNTAPFTLYLWHNGQFVLSSQVNLGIAQSPTVTGTYPVYLQYLSQDMQGVNPDGLPYNDPAIPDVSYFYQGEAIHGFIRASYGSPQSLGCVELPYANAQAAWPYLHIGTLVTIGP